MLSIEESEIKRNKLWRQVGLFFFNYYKDARSSTHKIQKMCSAHNAFMCCVRISEQTANISLYSINLSVFITEPECLLRGTNWAFKSDSYSSVLNGLTVQLLTNFFAVATHNWISQFMLW